MQPYNGPNAWMPLWKAARLRWASSIFLTPTWRQRERGLQKTLSHYSHSLGRSFPIYRGLIVRDKSDIKQITDLKGKRLAWDYGGHAINQTWQSAVMETAGLKATDVVQVRVSNLNDGVRAVPEGKVDASFTAVGIGVVEEANAMEPIRFLSMPNTATQRTKSWTNTAPRWSKSDAAAGIRGDTYVIGYPLQLVSSSKVSEKTVYALVKTWWDNLTELQTIHPLFKRWTKDPGDDKFHRAVSSRSDPIL